MSTDKRVFKVYSTTDPSGYPRFLLGTFKTQKEATAFQRGYVKGIFDTQVKLPFPKSKAIKCSK